MNDATSERTTCSANTLTVRTSLERAGWRFTPQRAAVFDYLCSVETHPSAEEVYASVRTRIPRLSLATVYKALEALVDCGLASKLDYADGPARYDHRTDAHYHFRCTRTGQVRDLPVAYDPQLLSKLDGALLDLLRAQGIQLSGYRLELLGELPESAASCAR